MAQPIKVLKGRHINEGKQGSCSMCPIALAILDALGDKWDVAVSATEARIWQKGKLVETLRTIPLKAKVTKFIDDFDGGLPVKPFRFTL